VFGQQASAGGGTIASSDKPGNGGGSRQLFSSGNSGSAWAAVFIKVKKNLKKAEPNLA
jgi:hypothetical protein